MKKRLSLFVLLVEIVAIVVLHTVKANPAPVNQENNIVAKQPEIKENKPQVSFASVAP